MGCPVLSWVFPGMAPYLEPLSQLGYFLTSMPQSPEMSITRYGLPPFSTNFTVLPSVSESQYQMFQLELPLVTASVVELIVITGELVEMLFHSPELYVVPASMGNLE